jgi:hypothetical protein
MRFIEAYSYQDADGARSEKMGSMIGIQSGWEMEASALCAAKAEPLYEGEFNSDNYYRYFMITCPALGTAPSTFPADRHDGFDCDFTQV